MNTPPPSPSPAARWARIQAVSGLLFGTFLALHLANTALAPLGVGTYDGVQRILRLYYRNPLVEIVAVVGSMLVHMVAGVVRIRMRPSGGTPTMRVRLHRYAGMFLLVFAVGHLAATRAPSVLQGIDLGFAGLSYSLARFPGYFYPYYAALGLAGLYHGLHGAGVALGVLGVRVPETFRKGAGFRTVLGTFGPLLLLALAAFGGQLFAIHDPMDNAFARLGESLLAKVLP